jgi:thioredoxin-like negative regulator of GroEL
VSREAQIVSIHPVLFQALEATKQTDTWLIVLATSPSSRECATMKDILSNAEIAAWIEANGSTLSFDIDADINLAAELGIRVVPTFLAFKGGEERGRLRGLRDWVHLLMWLHDLQRAKVEVGDVPTGREEDVRTREEAARALFRGGRYAEALEHYVWLWNNMARLFPDIAGVRGSFLARELDGGQLRTASSRSASKPQPSRPLILERWKRGRTGWSSIRS